MSAEQAKREAAKVGREAKAAERRKNQKEEARLEAQGRQAEAKAMRAAVNEAKKIGRMHWGQYFNAHPAKAIAVIRVRGLYKGKPGHTAKHAEEHNDPARENVTDPDHIDPMRIKDNLLIFQRMKQGRPESMTECLSDYRSRGLLCEKYSKAEGLELLFGMSPEVWDAIKPEHKDEFAKAWGEELRAFIAKRFEGARLFQIVLHRDEIDARPNAKALLLPLAPTWQRGAAGQGRQPVFVDYLNPQTGQPVFDAQGQPKKARQMRVSKVAYGLGKPYLLSRLQTEFANHLRQRGYHVERGKVQQADTTKTKHKTTREFKREKAELMRQTEALKAQQRVSLGASVFMGLSSICFAAKAKAAQDWEAEAKAQAKAKAEQQAKEVLKNFNIHALNHRQHLDRLKADWEAQEKAAAAPARTLAERQQEEKRKALEERQKALRDAIKGQPKGSPHDPQKSLKSRKNRLG